MKQDRTSDRLPLAPNALEVLLALAEGPAHGYALLKRVTEQSGGAVRLGTSTLYALLHRLAAEGLVEDVASGGDASDGPPRRTFRLTDSGLRVARLEVARLRRTLALAADRLGSAAARGGGAG